MPLLIIRAAVRAMRVAYCPAIISFNINFHFTTFIFNRLTKKERVEAQSHQSDFSLYHVIVYQYPSCTEPA
ncbi:MAG: hypothetical protein KDB91_08230, partial [Bacteroidales bacterium]|nr:hypothetical protein [Bacteroidales bacterium]